MIIAVAVALTSCGGGESDTGAATDRYPPPTAPPENARKGGALTVLASGDVDYIDPGAAYYQFTYMVTGATQRPLLSWRPDDVAAPSPDLASGPPQVSSDNRALTFDLKRGVRFSPPVNREATVADVKYAIERGLMPSVANGYAASYLGDLEGFHEAEVAVTKHPTKAPSIAGIQIHGDHTIVFRLAKPEAAVVEQALSLPLSSPVPREYAAAYDARNPSTYGENQVATGPYMVDTYAPGKEIRLTRNPNWDPSTDWRPGYLDSIDIREGFNDTVSASKKILAGSGQVSGDFSPPGEALKEAVSDYPSQLAVTPSGASTYAALNMSKPPFDDLNIRRAAVAEADRKALQAAMGGPLVGEVATHFIPPSIPGFEEAGGAAGPQGSKFDFLKRPEGDPQLAAQYMRKAGYPSGRCTGGGCKITMVASNDPGPKEAAVIVREALSRLGFDVSQRFLNLDVMYTKFCGVPKNEPNVCPSVGWGKDFNDPQSILDLAFNGENIVPANNSNWSLLDDQFINRAMDQARLINDPVERAEAWGEIDDRIVAKAPAIPMQWRNVASIRSQDVAGVINLFNAAWDLSFSSVGAGTR